MDSVSVTETTVSRADAQIHVMDIAGSGPTVVVLPGLAGSSREFLPTARALCPDFRTVLVDQRGHGTSTRRPSDISRAAFVDDVVAVIEQLAPPTPVALVGQIDGRSHGCSDRGGPPGSVLRGSPSHLTLRRSLSRRRIHNPTYGRSARSQAGSRRESAVVWRPGSGHS
jgi:hypothetical protein